MTIKVINLINVKVCPNCRFSEREAGGFGEMRYEECGGCGESFYVYKVKSKDSLGNNVVLIKSSNHRLSEAELGQHEIHSFHDVFGRSR